MRARSGIAASLGSWRSRRLYADEPARGWMPWGAFAPVLAVVFVALAVGSLTYGLGRLGLLDARDEPRGFPGLVAFLFLPFAALGGLVLGWVRFVERRPLATIGLARAGCAPAFGRGLALALAMSSALVAAIGLAGGYVSGALFPAFASPRALAKIALLLAGFAVQSSVEEIVFRGWLFSAVTRKLGRLLGLLLTSAVFALLHFEPHQPFRVTLATLLFSVFACCWTARAGAIWGAMGWHAAWNWFLGVGFAVPITALDLHVPALVVELAPRGSAALAGGSQGPEGSLLCSLLFAFAIAVLLARARSAEAPRAPEGIPSAPAA